MSLPTIAHSVKSCQERTSKMTRLSEKQLDVFIRDLIDEYSINRHTHYELFVSNLPFSIQKLFLSHVLDTDEYVWSIENNTRLERVLAENKPYLQSLIDNVAEERFADHMQDAGFKAYHHEDNNDVYWAKY